MGDIGCGPQLIMNVHLWIVVLSCVVFSTLTRATNLRPIIGIVTEWTGDEKLKNQSYIAASYVKFIESSGGRVVPILNNSTEDQVKELFHSINGVLFPGGDSSLSGSKYLDVAKIIFKLAKEANDNGDYFPLWGTCLGFQLLCVLQTGTDKVLTDFDSENYSIPLNLTDSAHKSRLFSMYSSEEMMWLAEESLTMNNHHVGISPQLFASTSSLQSFYSILSTNFDRKGKEFVSSMEANKYPFYGVQWHPEKNSFEWTTYEGINHSLHAVIITQKASNFFVEEARKSKHHFSSREKETNALIYNYSPKYSGITSHSFVQEYIF